MREIAIWCCFPIVGGVSLGVHNADCVECIPGQSGCNGCDGLALDRRCRKGASKILIVVVTEGRGFLASVESHDMSLVLAAMGELG
jgi:hypothetical protein